MDRQTAEEIVTPYILKVNGYQAIHRLSAFIILGVKLYTELSTDKVRRQGPKPGFIYPWNIVDYLSGYVKPNAKPLSKVNRSSKKPTGID